MEDQVSIAERKAALSAFLSFYGPLLTESQRTMVRLFADEDCSFTEIGEVCGVSRQCAFDTVSRAERQMADYENRLGLVSASRAREEALGRCLLMADPDSRTPREALARIREILRALMDREDR